MGCGRLFEGTAAQMYANLQRLAGAAARDAGLLRARIYPVERPLRADRRARQPGSASRAWREVEAARAAGRGDGADDDRARARHQSVHARQIGGAIRRKAARQGQFPRLRRKSRPPRVERMEVEDEDKLLLAGGLGLPAASGDGPADRAATDAERRCPPRWPAMSHPDRPSPASTCATCAATGRPARARSSSKARAARALWVNQPAGGCPTLDSAARSSPRRPTTQLCRGDIAEVVDPVAHIGYGGCGLGDFTPYRRVPALAAESLISPGNPRALSV